MKDTDFNYTSALQRNFKFGNAEITYWDNGQTRRAELRFEGARKFEWSSDDKNKWVASALCSFAKDLRLGKSLKGASETAKYQIACLIGYTMCDRNVGRYWHEYNNPNEISAAITTAQVRSGRVFNVPGNALKNYAELRLVGKPSSEPLGSQIVAS